MELSVSANFTSSRLLRDENGNPIICQKCRKGKYVADIEHPPYYWFHCEVCGEHVQFAKNVTVE